MLNFDTLALAIIMICGLREVVVRLRRSPAMTAQGESHS
ncbi:hypothetical protein SAMN05216224_102446 [Thioclava dalianensis]|nr:hypothetical protein SAMN05216224_102446 [Thioclava dalianensis]